MVEGRRGIVGTGEFFRRAQLGTERWEKRRRGGEEGRGGEKRRGGRRGGEGEGEEERGEKRREGGEVVGVTTCKT